MKTGKAILVLLIFVGLSAGASIEIFPAIVSFDYIPPGFKFNMDKMAGIPILVPNNNDTKLQFSISFSASKALESLLPGYSNFPDISWCHLEPDTNIWVEANDTGRVNLVFEIPQEDKYYNQYWELGVVIRGLKGVEMKTSGLSLGILPSVKGSYLISTTPKMDKMPDKTTAIIPSAGIIKKEEAIKGKTVTFKICNNDTVAHDYKIEPYEFPQFEWYDIRLAIQVTGDNKQGETSWLKTSKGFLFFKKNVVHIEPGESAEWSVKVKLPNKKEIKDSNWDLVVKILPEGEKINSGIFRIMIEDVVPGENE